MLRKRYVEGQQTFYQKGKSNLKSLCEQAVLGISNPTLFTLDDLLEGLTGHGSERVQIKLNEGSKVQEEPNTSLQVSSPSGVAQTNLTLPGMTQMTIHEKHHKPGKLTQVLMSTVFIDLTNSSLPPPQAKTGICHRSHC